MKKKTNAIFENLMSISAVTVKTFGQNYEVAIHDFSKLPHSLVHIEGNVTKRKPGAPITDLVVRALRRDGDAIKNFINYKTVTKEGRIVKSSTTFIRDEKGKVIGAYCINFDMTDYLNAIALFNDFTRTEGRNDQDHKETFATSLNETVESLMEPIVNEIGRQPATMNKEEKLKLLKALEFQGTFLLRGAVDFVAKILGVSKFTVYNYLKEIRSDSDIL